MYAKTMFLISHVFKMNLSRFRSIENRNWTNSERFREEYRKSIDEICDVMNELREGHTVTITEIRDIIGMSGA